MPMRDLVLSLKNPDYLREAGEYFDSVYWPALLKRFPQMRGHERETRDMMIPVFALGMVSIEPFQARMLEKGMIAIEPPVD